MKCKKTGADHRFEVEIDDDQIRFKTSTGKLIAKIEVETCMDLKYDEIPTDDFFLCYTAEPKLDTFSCTRFISTLVETTQAPPKRNWREEMQNLVKIVSELQSPQSNKFVLAIEEMCAEIHKTLNLSFLCDTNSRVKDGKLTVEINVCGYGNCPETTIVANDTKAFWCGKEFSDPEAMLEAILEQQADRWVWLAQREKLKQQDKFIKELP